MDKYDMNILVPVSYMGSGSSALTDLLGEYAGINALHEDFEYVFLHCPNGLFDLEDKLLLGNTALRSDEALHSFLERMEALFQKNWWVGNYEAKIGNHFRQACADFVNQLIDAKPDFYWYEQERNLIWMYPRLLYNKLLRVLSCGKIRKQRPLTHPAIWLSWPSPEEFYAKAQAFLRAVFLPLAAQARTKQGQGEKETTHFVFDQLLLPHNLHRLENYFPAMSSESPASALHLRALVIHRDPRDVFISNKYYWSKQHVPLPYPTDVQAFCSMYRKLRESEKPADSTAILRLQFEDLIYHYEESCQKIEEFLQLSPEKHTQPFSRFDPKRSIQNTQLFYKDEAWLEEAAVLAKELKDYCYDFPYVYQNQDGQVF